MWSESQLMGDAEGTAVTNVKKWGHLSTLACVCVPLLQPQRQASSPWKAWRLEPLWTRMGGGVGVDLNLSV